MANVMRNFNGMVHIIDISSKYSDFIYHVCIWLYAFTYICESSRKSALPRVRLSYLLPEKGKVSGSSAALCSIIRMPSICHS